MDAFDLFKEKQWFRGFLMASIYDRNGSTEDAAKKEGQVPDAGPDELLKEMKSIMAWKPFPWEAIVSLANYSEINTEEETRAWLQKMIDIIEANRPAPKKPTNALLKKLGFGKDALENPNDKK